MDPIYQDLAYITKSGEKAALATVIDTKGSTPRKATAKMIVGLNNKRIAGTIGGGVLEASVIQEAQNVLSSGAPKIFTKSLVPTGADSELVCGGTIQILIEPLTDSILYQRIAELISDKKCAALATLMLGEPKQVQKWLYTSSGLLYGVPPSSIAGTIYKHVDWAIKSETHLNIPVEINGLKGEVFLEPVVSPTLFLLGAGHVSLAISKLVQSVEFSLVVCDERENEARPDRFPGAEIVTGPLTEILPKVEVGEDGYIAICTFSHKHDRQCLAWAVTTKARYIGLLGSRTKFSTIKAELIQQGFNPTCFERVRTPMGLNIGAQTPEEIAIATVAELIQVRRSSFIKEIQHSFHSDQGSSSPLNEF